jgi:transmembrane sensor
MKSNIDNLIAKHLSGNSTAGENLELQGWITQSSENERYFIDARNLWNASRSLSLEVESDTDAAWSEFETRVQKPARVFRLEPMRVAAAIAFLVCTFFVVRFFISGNQDTVSFTKNIAANADTSFETPIEVQAQISTPDTTPDIQAPVKHKPFVKRKTFTQLAMIAVSSEDSAMIVTLPDESKVYLNRNSKLTYAENFSGSNRVVHLSGEAYFEVAAGEDPFFVYCRDTKSRALASAFNVMGYENREIEVSVIEGLVEVTKVAPSQTRIIIGKGEKVVYNAENEQFLQAKVTKKEKWWKRISFRTRIKNFINRIIHRD